MSYLMPIYPKEKAQLSAKVAELERLDGKLWFMVRGLGWVYSERALFFLCQRMKLNRKKGTRRGRTFLFCFVLPIFKPFLRSVCGISSCIPLSHLVFTFSTFYSPVFFRKFHEFDGPELPCFTFCMLAFFARLASKVIIVVSPFSIFSRFRVSAFLFVRHCCSTFSGYLGSTFLVLLVTKHFRTFIELESTTITKSQGWTISEFVAAHAACYVIL